MFYQPFQYLEINQLLDVDNEDGFTFTKRMAATKTEHMEVMQARLTALEPNDCPLTTLALLVVNSVK